MKLNDQAKPGRPKSVDSEAVFQVREANMANSTWRIEAKIGILRSSIVHHIQDLSKNIWSWEIVPHITKIMQNIWYTLVYICVNQTKPNTYSYIHMYEYVFGLVWFYGISTIVGWCHIQDTHWADMYVCAYIYIYTYIRKYSWLCV